MIRVCIGHLRIWANHHRTLCGLRSSKLLLPARLSEHAEFPPCELTAAKMEGVKGCVWFECFSLVSVAECAVHFGSCSLFRKICPGGRR